MITTIIRWIIGFGTLGFILYEAVLLLVGATCIPYVINTWLVFAGKTPQVLWWHGAFMLGLAGWVLPLFWLTIFSTAATWVMMMFLR